MQQNLNGKQEQPDASDHAMDGVMWCYNPWEWGAGGEPAPLPEKESQPQARTGADELMRYYNG